jgi:hypothetical protein
MILMKQQIAADFGSVERTVNVHRARVMSKMRVRTVSELVWLGARVGMTIESALGAARGCPDCPAARMSNIQTARLRSKNIGRSISS